MHKGVEGLCLRRETWCSQHFVLNGVRITDKLEAINPPLHILLIFIYLFTYLELWAIYLLADLASWTQSRWTLCETKQPPFAVDVVEGFTPPPPQIKQNLLFYLFIFFTCAISTDVPAAVVMLVRDFSRRRS